MAGKNPSISTELSRQEKLRASQTAALRRLSSEKKGRLLALHAFAPLSNRVLDQLGRSAPTPIDVVNSEPSSLAQNCDVATNDMADSELSPVRPSKSETLCCSEYRYDASTGKSDNMRSKLTATAVTPSSEVLELGAPQRRPKAFVVPMVFPKNLPRTQREQMFKEVVDGILLEARTRWPWWAASLLDTVTFDKSRFNAKWLFLPLDAPARAKTYAMDPNTQPPLTINPRYKGKKYDPAKAAVSRARRGGTKAKEEKAILQTEVSAENAEIAKLKTALNKANNKLTQVNNRLRNQHTDLVRYGKANGLSIAADEFQATGKSKYLLSVLLPDEGPQECPDDIVRLHTVKAETVTYNVNVPTSGAGLFVLYPNHPTDLIGEHYSFNGTTYAYDTTLRTAQTLPTNYDYGKRISQMVKIWSSTLPAGAYAINGTINAVRIDGTLSETPGLTEPTLYSQLLTNTTNVLDKIGNVLVNEGIVCLSLPETYDQPYVRMNDNIPTTLTAGNVISSRIKDNSETLNYDLDWEAATPLDVVATVETTLVSGVMAIDSVNGLQGRCIVNLEPSVNLGTNTFFIRAEYNAQTAWGEAVDNVSFSCQLPYNQSYVGADTNWPISAELPFYIHSEQSIAQLNFRIFITSTANVTLNYINGQMLVEVPGGRTIGVNTPIMLVAYQGMVAESVMTVSGVTNFELVPNPNLRQNLEIEYGEKAPMSMDYTRVVLGNRQKFGIRTIWNGKDYAAWKPLARELADTTTHKLASAFDWGDLIKVAKERLLPAGLKLIEPFVDRVPGLKTALNIAVPEITSRANYSASGRVFAATDILSGVLFPTIDTDNQHNALNASLYAVVNKIVHSQDVPKVYTNTADGFRIYGYEQDEIYPFSTNRDLTVCRVNVDAWKEGRFVVEPSNPVEGHSCDGAIWVLCNARISGLSKYAVTGEVLESPCSVYLQPNPVFSLKHARCLYEHIPLMANDPQAEINAEFLAL